MLALPLDWAHGVGRPWGAPLQYPSLLHWRRPLSGICRRSATCQTLRTDQPPRRILRFEGARRQGWLAAFFSTNAPHVAQVTKQLLWPNFRYRDESDITTVCFTLNAEYDTPEVLNKYVERNTRYNGFQGKWQFLTGEQNRIDSIISESFMIERDPVDPDNIATLWLVDSKGFLRGVTMPHPRTPLRTPSKTLHCFKRKWTKLLTPRKETRGTHG